MPQWIVKCSICGKRFEVTAPVMPVSMPPVSVIEIPPHEKLNQDGVPGIPNAPCTGSTVPGLGVGRAEGGTAIGDPPRA